MKLTFCGAAKIVTGSCYLIESGKDKVLVDCGMFQGRKEITKLNYENFRFNPKEITHVFLTHAHIDHSGLIPKLVKYGFKGKILATSATVDLCRIMLEDSAHIQEIDNRHENERRKREKLPLRQPLYTIKDAKNSLKFFKKIEYGEEYNIGNIKVVYRDAGHIVGSAMIEMFVEDKKIVFSGDLGQWNVPIVRNPTLIKDADYVLIESTYGDRIHEDVGLRDDLLLKHVKKTFDKGGKLMIPSFAIERTQELLYSFGKMIKQGKFPNQKVFLDSPLAIKATEIFKKHHEVFDKEALSTDHLFTFPNLIYTSSVDESKKINDYNQPCVIIAGSGMCTGGRIRHHLKNHLGESKNSLLFVGFQAEGTLGRIILEGAKKIKMMGLIVPVKASVDKINSFSSHADYNDILKWAKAFSNVKKFFVIHGELKASKSLKNKLERSGFKGHIPNIGEMVEL